MKDRDKHIDLLYEATVTISKIFCCNCGTESSVEDLDDMMAAEYFFRKGWRVDDEEESYCPECSEERGLE